MSKFKKGDTVKRTEVCHVDRNIGIGTIHIVKEVSGNWIKVKGSNKQLSEKAFKLSEPEFKNGDEVEVSDDGRNWEHAFYVEINPIYKDHHVAIMEDGTYAYSYKYCRHPRKEYTLKECADALGVPVEEFRIKDE